MMQEIVKFNFIPTTHGEAKHLVKLWYTQHVARCSLVHSASLAVLNHVEISDGRWTATAPPTLLRLATFSNGAPLQPSRLPPFKIFDFLIPDLNPTCWKLGAIMRLLNTTSLKLQLFTPDLVPDYVILSHRWCSEEVLFEDLAQSPISDPHHPARTKEGFAKIEGVCRLARQDGYDWIWIDSCCIDKSSSAVLQKAINSIWNYYSGSNICYVYMWDVSDSATDRQDSAFRESEWFTRGWTLQELIAPTILEFYARDWSPIGTKHQRLDEIAAITSISPEILIKPELADLECAAEKLS
jgi:hypothetical protein